MEETKEVIHTLNPNTVICRHWASISSVSLFTVTLKSLCTAVLLPPEFYTHESGSALTETFITGSSLGGGVYCPFFIQDVLMMLV